MKRIYCKSCRWESLIPDYVAALYPDTDMPDTHGALDRETATIVTCGPLVIEEEVRH